MLAFRRLAQRGYRYQHANASRLFNSSSAVYDTDHYDLVIRGGEVCTASEVFRADVGIKNGIVQNVGLHLPKGGKEIDAHGMLVLPGGVDTHCHIEQTRELGGPLSCGELFDTGTTSAACGGTTTTLSFCQQMKGATLAEAIADYSARASAAVIDHGFHIVINDPSEAILEELPSVIAQGHRSLKIFMTYPHNRVKDDGILKILQVARENAALVTFHCENHDAIVWQTNKLIEHGLTQPKHFAWSKPSVVEREAVCRAIALAELTDCPIQIFHVTCEEVADEIARAQQRGVKVWAETCTHYLHCTESDLDRPNMEGAKYIHSPAPRSAKEHDALWKHIHMGTLTNVTSDHAPAYFYGRREGEIGKLDAGANAGFNEIANGMPGLETRMAVLFHKGVTEGRISINQFVALTSTNAAKLFGLYPKKGSVMPGADADVVVWDPNKNMKISQSILHHHADYTPFEDMEVTGWPTATISRGEIIALDGQPTASASPGRGKFLKREVYPFISPTQKFPTPFNPYNGNVQE
eukprot:m.114488 g.114488  ORF g.114488 m.114488 type:complete len:524 (+) comp28355_c0_seq3:228-1799(+)